jgi:hypothetical protein
LPFRRAPHRRRRKPRTLPMRTGLTNLLRQTQRGAKRCDRSRRLSRGRDLSRLCHGALRRTRRRVAGKTRRKWSAGARRFPASDPGFASEARRVSGLASGKRGCESLPLRQLIATGENPNKTGHFSSHRIRTVENRGGDPGGDPRAGPSCHHCGSGGRSNPWKICQFLDGRVLEAGFSDPTR